MKTPKVYIAGKIGNLPEIEYKSKFNEGKEDVSFRGFEPISPVDLPHNHERTWEAYMREDLKEMLDCDAVYALKNWVDSPGAIVEVTLAQKVGIPVVFQETQNWADIPEKILFQ